MGNSVAEVSDFIIEHIVESGSTLKLKLSTVAGRPERGNNLVVRKIESLKLLFLFTPSISGKRSTKTVFNASVITCIVSVADAGCRLLLLPHADKIISKTNNRHIIANSIEM